MNPKTKPFPNYGVHTHHPSDGELPNRLTQPMVAEAPMVFHCGACGECCSSWNMLIENEKAEYLKQQAWVQERLSDLNLDIEVVSKTHALLPQTPEKMCAFLGEGGKCLVHQYEGLAQKPNECQRFPFASVELETGIAFDTSAACKHVAQSLVLAFQPIVPEDPELPPPQDGEGPPMPRQVLVRGHSLGPIKINYGRAQISWHQYRQWMSVVRSWCQDVHLNTPSLLKSIQHSLETLADGANVGQDHLQSGRFRNTWRQWGIPLTLREPYGTYSRWQRWAEGRYQDPMVLGFEALPLNTIQGLPWINDMTLLRYRHGFIYHLLQRKKPFSFGHSLENLFSLVCVADSLVCWHAKALAYLDSEAGTSPQVAPYHMRDAIRLVERYYTGHQPHFFDQFRTHWFWSKAHRWVLA